MIATAIFGLITAGAYTARAASVITDRQIDTIRARCGEIQATLNRIHESDKVLRVNKGYRYKAVMLDKLMTPLNQRIATNQVDGGKLVSIAAEYSRVFQQFDSAYGTYERSLSAALQTDCTKQPTAFYDQLTGAYENRKQVAKADAKLADLSKDFKAEFEKVFGATVKEAAQ